MSRRVILIGLTFSFLLTPIPSYSESEKPKKTFAEEFAGNKRNLDLLIAKVRETFEKIKIKLVEFRDHQKESRESIQNLNQKTADASKKAEKSREDTKAEIERTQTTLREQADYQKRLQQNTRAEQERMKQMQREFNRQYKQ